jgi:hypothetical protein
MASGQDPALEELARLFRDHPAWQRAAALLDASATSDVYFTHRPGDVWHLERRGVGSELLPGPARAPDLAFRFTPGSVSRLADAGDSIGEFAVELLTRITDPDARTHIDLRIAADFEQLRRRGYVKLLLAGGPSILRFGARHGILTAGALRRFVAETRKNGPAEW